MSEEYKVLYQKTYHELCEQIQENLKLKEQVTRLDAAHRSEHALRLKSQSELEQVYSELKSVNVRLEEMYESYVSAEAQTDQAMRNTDYWRRKAEGYEISLRAAHAKTEERVGNAHESLGLLQAKYNSARNNLDDVVRTFNALEQEHEKALKEIQQLKSRFGHTQENYREKYRALSEAYEGLLRAHSILNSNYIDVIEAEFARQHEPKEITVDVKLETAGACKMIADILREAADDLENKRTKPFIES